MRSRLRRLASSAGLVATLVVAGCSSGGGADCPVGERNCACNAGRCLTGLSCVDGVCRGSSGGLDAGTVGGFDAGRTVPPGVDAGPEIPDVGPNPDAFFADDPPPMECREDGTMGPPPEPPGGTPECPDDKNREGCRCTEIGSTAPCWPGLRVNRNRGICRDGTTTCEPFDEFTGRWGACEGYVLPAEGVELGPQACRCFSMGRWELDNLSPCFATIGSTVYAVSTVDGACPDIGDGSGPPPIPTAPWSTNRLTVDCEGRFDLCYTLRAGDFDAPSDTDCVVAEVCTMDWYAERDVTQEFPVLPAWRGDDTACARQFMETGGYGEMSVRGLSVECDDISEGGESYVFNRVNYCPLDCADRPDDPECMRCMMGGSGSF